MKLHWILLFSLVFGCALPGCKPSEKAIAEKAATDSEVKALEGKWKISFREGSQSEDEEEGDKPVIDPTYYYVIEKNILREEFKGRDGAIEVISRRKMTIDPNKTPKTVDLVYVDDKGNELKERTVKKGITGKKKPVTKAIKDVGIYKLDGDKLEFCISWDEKNRPTDFTAPPKSSRYAFKLERIKDGSEPKAAEEVKDKPKDEAKDKKDKPKDEAKDKKDDKKDEAKEKAKS
ncbi:TIGR03067 domain-containing protein [Zavarzinella formosa]|uniref:TIGR03067 domain-containing protein n=1 Tax=Zavarzinella formosa TaxID=360055 RepID=UPI0002DAEF52|nr:TIGR03067 domain-containing protein [Zavarzinella formosa]